MHVIPMFSLFARQVLTFCGWSTSFYVEEQDQLIAHSFIGFLSLAPIDLQMGITTMDMNVENPGLLVGEMMTPYTPMVPIVHRANVIGRGF